MVEVLAVARLLDNAPRRGVHLEARDSRRRLLDRRGLRRENRLPDLSILVRRLAEPGRPRDVVVVTLGPIPGVDEDRLVAGQRARAGGTVGKRRGRAELHDVVSAESRRDVGFDGAGAQRGERLLEPPDCDGDRPPHGVDLLGRLHHAERPERRVGRDGLPARALPEKLLDVVVGRGGLDGEDTRRRGKKGRRPREGVLGFVPGDDAIDGRHAAQPRFLEGGADHRGLAVSGQEERRQPLAAVKVDAGQVKEIRRGRGVEGVGADRGEP